MSVTGSPRPSMRWVPEHRRRSSRVALKARACIPQGWPVTTGGDPPASGSPRGRPQLLRTQSTPRESYRALRDHVQPCAEASTGVFALSAGILSGAHVTNHPANNRHHFVLPLSIAITFPSASNTTPSRWYILLPWSIRSCMAAETREALIFSRCATSR